MAIQIHGGPFDLDKLRVSGESEREFLVLRIGGLDLYVDMVDAEQLRDDLTAELQKIKPPVIARQELV